MSREDLIIIGRLAIADNIARAARNKAQQAVTKWRRQYQREAGVAYDDMWADADDKAEHDALMKVKLDAQAGYYRARSATRRAIARANAQEKQHG